MFLCCVGVDFFYILFYFDSMGPVFPFSVSGDLPESHLVGFECFFFVPQCPKLRVTGSVLIELSL